MFRCIHRIACRLSSTSSAHFCIFLTLRGEFYMVHTVYCSIFDYYLAASKSVAIPRLSCFQLLGCLAL